MTKTRARTKPAARTVGARTKAVVAQAPPPFDHPAAEILWLLRKTPLQPLAKTLTPTRGGRSAPQNVTPQLLHDLAAATVTAFWNEIAFDGKDNTHDPIKWRFGAFRSDQTGYLAAIVGDILEGSRRLEKIIIALKLDSSAESRANGWPSIPMVEVFCHRYGDSSTNDADMLRVISLSAAEIVCWAPVRFMQGGAQAPPGLPPAPPPVGPTIPPPIPPPIPPSPDDVYRITVNGIPYSFRQGHWEDIGAVFPFPVDDDVVRAYTAAPSWGGWVVLVNRMFTRRDD